MKLYIAVCCDRHIDEEVTAHLTREAAIEYARGFMLKCVGVPTGLVEEDADDRWSIYYAYEDDHAFVVEVQAPNDARPVTRGRGAA